MTRNLALNADPHIIAAIDLDRVLIRLERKVLSSEAELRLQHSNYERSKTSANLEYARTLLLRLEHDSSSIKIQSRKAAAQTSLSGQRALIKRLTDRLHDLDQTGDDDDLLYGPSDEEDILGEDPTPSPVPPPSAPTANHDPDRQTSSFPSSSHQPTEPTSTLRNRLQPSNPPNAKPPTKTDLIEDQDLQSASLTTSLLTLARALKAASSHFSDSLVADSEALNRATDGLDKNATGMEAAGKRMGLLKRMSEGKGWLGRMMLYAWIAGLWLVALGLVFVGPKLRF